MAQSEEREFDLVLWGATGYTGRLVAAGLAGSVPAGLRWALGGRDRDRLERLRSELGVGPGLVVADAHDDEAMGALARRTRVVATTVGPYARRGTPLVAACASAGTHYADLTAEIPWMRRTIDAYHETARASGARIVHACGFESIPSDLGVWMLQRAAIDRHGRACGSVGHGLGPIAVGGVSGGTVASALELVEGLVGDRDLRRQLTDPDVLAPDGAHSPTVPVMWWPRRDADLGGWTAPVFTGLVNERVVRRTRALLGEPWGEGFRYRERWLARSWPEAAAVSLGHAAAVALVAVGPLRRWAVRRWLPRPGEGPTPEARSRGYFRTRLAGRVEGLAEPVIAGIECDLDPGYGATAIMLRETALSLACDELDGRGGVLTPAAACGERLLERLQRSGVRFVLEGG